MQKKIDDRPRRYLPATALRAGVYPHSSVHFALPLIAVSIFALFALLLFPVTASAHGTTKLSTRATGPHFSVSAGFDTRYRDGNWVPVTVSLSNDGPDFNGTLSISIVSPFGSTNNNPTATYQVPVNLANGAQKQVVTYIPLETGTSGATQSIIVSLLDNSNHVVSRQSSTLNALGSGDVFVGVLSDQLTGFAPLNAVPLPNQGGSVIVEQLSATAMPASAAVLKNFDVIVLDNFTSGNLSPAQLSALDTWVNQGGTLIEVGGPEWRRTLSPLPVDLLPVTISGTGTIPAKTSLLPVGGPDKSGVDAQGIVPDTVDAAVPISKATLATTKAISLLNAGTTPLIVQAQQGEGNISYLAFDPTLEPLAGWSGASMLWKGLLLRNLGDQLLSSANSSVYGTNQENQFVVGGMDGLLQTLMPNTIPSPWLLLVLLAGYLLILGPVRLLIVRWRNKRSWSWRIVLASIAVFSVLTYGLALQEKGTSILSDSISIIQLNGGTNTLAHETTYLGVFVPNQGDFLVHLPGNVLAQPAPNEFNTTTGQRTTISPNGDGTDVNLQGVDIWTLRSILAQQDQPVHGGVISHLQDINGTLKGSITNTLNYSLSDVYVLMTNSFAHIGNLAAGQTIHVNQLLDTSNNGGSYNIPLATQIAMSANGGQPYYGPYYNSNGQPLSETQRHLAILSALSGQGVYGVPVCGGGPCPVVPVTSVGNSILSSGSPSFSYQSSVLLSGSGPLQGYSTDPLLVPNAPATLIGWANTQASGNNPVTINGSAVSGLAETLIQTPIDLSFSGPLNLPTNYLLGQPVDVQSKGNNVQLEAPGVYVLTTGSMTFEFSLPAASRLHVDNMTIQEPSTLTQTMPSVGTSSGPTDVNHMQTYVYNWQSNSWDSYPMQEFNLSLDNIAPYIGPNGRVLVQFLNTDPSVGSILLARPSLSVDGTVS
ncbi:MAG TPA: hypothetical protein VKV40_07840 [Ktedonobacteraceae bacterium]|nr:hypothetical protein [Ktedonobacteraceae bacterium]